jgi:N-(5'phosphoribosyl)anthranilate (PRA) isomerase
MKRFISGITVTGADDSVSPTDILELIKEYPFLEIGILLSRSSENTPSFPSKTWITDLHAEFKRSDNINHAIPPFSGHICGEWVKDIFRGSWPLTLDTNQYDDLFSRWQLNTRGIFHETNALLLSNIIDQQNHKKVPKEVIFQYDQYTDTLLKNYHNNGLNISTLFDTSHGNGILPNSWIRPLNGVKCGYAGGLTPDNIKIEALKIGKHLNNQLVWLDIQSGVRSSAYNLFDISKVKTLLNNISNMVLK